MSLKRLKMKMAVLIFVCCGSPPALAGIPTIDIANVIQSVITALETIEQTIGQAEQIANQINQIQNQARQIQQLDDQFAAMSGSYNISDLFNGAGDQDWRRAMPETWEDVMGMISAANANAGQRRARDAAIAAQESAMDFQATDVVSSGSSQTLTRLERDVNSIYAALGVGQEAYRRASENTIMLEQRSQQIDAQPDLKAAVDLNNALLIENGHLMNEVIRLNSATYVSANESRASEINRKAHDFRMSDSTIPAL